MFDNTQNKTFFYTSPKRSIFIGGLEGVVKRSNVASTLMIAVGSEMSVVNEANESVKCRSLLIPTGTEVTIHTHSAIIAQCFLDDSGSDLAKLIPQMKTIVPTADGGSVYTDITMEPCMINHFTYLVSERPANRIAIEQIDAWMDGYPAPKNYIYDPRVARAIEIIKDNYTVNLSVESIAVSVGLSVPRLSQIFKLMTGVPIRRFRLTYRAFVAADKLRQGASLTEAAIECGFADYSQMCRVFRELTGTKPSCIKQIDATLTAAA